MASTSTLTPKYSNLSTQPLPSTIIRSKNSASPTGRPLDLELPDGVTDMHQLSKSEQRQIKNHALYKRYEQTKRNLFPSKKWLTRRALVLEETDEKLQAAAAAAGNFIELEADVTHSDK